MRMKEIRFVNFERGEKNLCKCLINEWNKGICKRNIIVEFWDDIVSLI